MLIVACVLPERPNLEPGQCRTAWQIAVGLITVHQLEGHARNARLIEPSLPPGLLEMTALQHSQLPTVQYV